MDPQLLVVFGFTFLTTVAVLVSIGGVILLRPISKQLGLYLQAKAQAGKALGERSPEDWDRLFTALDNLTGRLENLEDRQDFTEKLLAKPKDVETRD